MSDSRDLNTLIDEAFDALVERLLTGRPGPMGQSLVGLYSDASGDRTGTVIRILRPYMESLQHHLDARRASAKAEMSRAALDRDPAVVLAASKNVVQNVRRVLETESTALRNVGLLAAIGERAERAGVEDPPVYFVTSAGCCAECRRLFWSAGTPRVWLYSELGSAYHRVGDSNPKVGGLHPNCRCTPVYIPGGYGFSKGGLVYVKKDHDELSSQRQSSAA